MHRQCNRAIMLPMNERQRHINVGLPESTYLQARAAAGAADMSLRKWIAMQIAKLLQPKADEA